MKNGIRIAGLGLVLCGMALFAACGGAQQKQGEGNETTETRQAAPVFENAELSGAFAKYLELKDALVASDGEAAKQRAAELQEALAGLEGMEEAAGAAGEISGAGSLEEQRTAFSGLSNTLSARLKEASLTEGSVYLAYCPMAEGNQGAYWLAAEPEIRNPYFGEKMLKCGEVKDSWN